MRRGPKSKGLTRYYGVRFRPETISELEGISAERDRTVSWVIRAMVEEAVAKRKQA
jgi:hypothetical protein